MFSITNTYSVAYFEFPVLTFIFVTYFKLSLNVCRYLFRYFFLISLLILNYRYMFSRFQLPLLIPLLILILSLFEK